MKLLPHLEEQSPPIKVILEFALVGIIGIFDFLTGYQLAFSVFYVIPISLSTWISGKRMGMIVSCASAVAWLAADLGSGYPYSHALIPLWNTIIRLSFFMIVTFLLSAVRSAMERENELARTDNLTGAVNSRHFFELAQLEFYRLQRYQHPFTFVYLDLDNFKVVNDQFGHIVGDQVLRTIVNFAKSNLRKIDVVARLGGDEFALLLPETDKASAQAAVSKLQQGLLEQMRQHNWPITFSMGVVTCSLAPSTVNELVNLADQLMYAVKHEGKNALKFGVYPG